MAGLWWRQHRRLTLALFVLLGLCSGLQAQGATDADDRVLASAVLILRPPGAGCRSRHAHRPHN